jgi:serine/threonine protein phosphatase PrpC
MDAKNTKSIESGLSKQQHKGQDVALVNEELSLYAVFDGVGNSENSLESALIASASIQASIERNQDKSVQNSPNSLVEAINEAHQEIVIESRFRPLGTTTATIAKLNEDLGRYFLAWVSVGDSRIYLRLKSSSSLDLLSRDESSGVYVDNCLGDVKHFHGVSQEGLIELERGSEIVIVSDGVFGNDKEDFLDIEEIDSALKTCETAQSAADKLNEISKKIDDKTAIVIRIK